MSVTSLPLLTRPIRVCIGRVCVCVMPQQRQHAGHGRHAYVHTYNAACMVRPQTRRCTHAQRLP